MKKALRFIGAMCYAAIVAYLIWLLLHFATPFAFQLGWFWIVAGGFVFAIVLITGISLIMYAPLMMLVRKDKWIGVLPVVATMLFGLSAVYDVWTLDMHYAFKEIFAGIILTISILYLYVGLCMSIFSYDKKN